MGREICSRKSCRWLPKFVSCLQTIGVICWGKYCSQRSQMWRSKERTSKLIKQGDVSDVLLGRITVMIWEVETSYYSGVISLSRETFSLSTIWSSTWLVWLNIETGRCCEGEQECVSFLELILIQKFTPALSKLSSVRRPQCDMIWFALNLHHFRARSTQRHDFLQVFAIQVDKRHWNSLQQIHNLIQG